MLMYQFFDGFVRICEGKDGKVTHIIVTLENKDMEELVRQWLNFRTEYFMKKEERKKE